MNHLWAVMSNKYPNTWRATYSSSPFNSGLITKIASEWVLQLTGLSNNEIKAGIDNLAQREEKRFPPNAMEFKELCTGDSYESVLDAVMCRLQDGESYKWTDRLAFNFWMKYSYDLLGSKLNDVPKLIKQNLKMIDETSLFELPDYSVKAIEKPKEVVSTIATINEVRIFQSHMTRIIYENNPELFKHNEIQSASEREFNREPMSALPPLMLKIFSRNGTLNLIKKFKSKGYVMPDIIAKPTFSTGNTLEYKTKKRNYRETIKKAMTNFLSEEKIIGVTS